MFNENLKIKIKDHAIRDIPNEACGLILDYNNVYSVFPCLNISYHKKEHSIISPLDYMKAEKIGRVIGMYHSQPNDGASILDQFSALENNLLSIIYCWLSDKFYFLEPKLKDYLNIAFNHLTNNCFHLVRNYYKKELNIELNNYIIDKEWFKKTPEFIYQNIFNENGVEVNFGERKKNDIIFFGKDRKRIQHMAIYLGNNLILHHNRDKNSSIEELTDQYIKNICMVVRHKSLF